MFLEDIVDKLRDKVKEEKASIATFFIILLGWILGYFIDGRFSGDFTGWWLFTFCLFVLFRIVLEFIFKFRRHTKKEVFSYVLTIGILIVGIALLYRTLV